MTATLAHLLPVVRPSFPEDLVSPKAYKRLEQLAWLLPPVARLLFECRLSAGDEQVDLSQCVLASNGERELLSRCLAGSKFSAVSWQRLRRLVDCWCDCDHILFRGLSSLWLEFDVGSEFDPNCPPSPALFLSFSPVAPGDGGDLEMVRRLTAFFTIVSGSGCTKEQVEKIVQFYRILPSDGQLGKIGMMLSRKPEQLRILASFLSAGQVKALCRKIGNGTLEGHHLNLVDTAYSMGAAVTLSIDISMGLSDRIGFELFFNHINGGEESLRQCLRKLTEKGCCSTEKMEALLGWPGLTTPENCGVEWPEKYIVESLLHGPDEFSLIDRQLSHLKLLGYGDSSIEAKAYLEVNHRWARFDNDCM